MFYDKQGKHVRTKKEILDENGLYLATKKIGKNNPKAEQIQTDNRYRMRWNREVDRAIVSGVTETEIQSRIDRKNEEIGILKIGLSGIVRRYGFQNVQDFYRVHNKALNAYADYKEQIAEWEKNYGENSRRQDKKSVLERLKNLPKKTADYQQQKTIKDKERDRGAR